MSVFVVEDQAHAEWCGEFSSFEAALEELKSRAKLPWDATPNVCPCMSWKTCGRDYEIIEYDDSNGKPWEQVSGTAVLRISSKGTVWDPQFLSSESEK